MGIKKSIKQQNSKQKTHIAPNLKEFRSWILRKVINNGKNNSLNISVRNIPKFKDRANWSRDTFQPMRRRACVYQQTNQNIATVIKNFQNSGRSRTESVTEALRHIFKTFHDAYTIFFSGQRIGKPHWKFLVKYSAHFAAYFFF